MSGPAFVVLPISNDGANYRNLDTTEIAQTIQESLRRKTHPQEYEEPEHHGPLKEIIDHKDSLYKYISWEDPTRTFGSYIGVLSLICAAHYLPLTQTALKAGMTSLGVISISEFASRQFGPNSLSARLRPEEYKKIPEPVLNDTLKDIHDLIQYVVVQAQRTFFGQDLDKTFAAFLGLAATYALIQFVSPFWLAVIGLTSVYIAPLAASPRGRAAARDASARAKVLANTAAEKGKEVAQNGKANAGELSSKAQQTAEDAQGRVQNVTQSGKQSVQDAGARVQNLAESGKQTAADQSARVRDTASDITSSAAEHVRINQVSEAASSTSGNAKQYVSNSLPGTAANGTPNQATQQSNNTVKTAKQLVPDSVADQVNSLANKVPLISSSTTENGGQMGPGSNDLDHRASRHPGNGMSTGPSQNRDGLAGSAVDTGDKFATGSDEVAAYGIMARPRGSLDA